MKSSHEVIISIQEVVLVVAKSDLVATVLGEEHGVALLDSDGSHGSVVEGAARADCDNNTEVQLLLILLGQENATLGLDDGLGLLDEDTVHQWAQLLECDHL